MARIRRLVPGRGMRVALATLMLSVLAHGRVSIASSADTCGTLSGRALQAGAVTLAETVRAGEFVAPGATTPNAAMRTLPAFCRVAATLTPTADSDIKIEVWMPIEGWNGKFQAIGNGGWSGSIAYAAMATALARGYAVSSTDTGHQGGSASFALGHPEKLIDFGFRAVHEMTMAAKTLVAAYYNRGATRAYWNGCSAGGRQGLKEAQQFPSDFDGIVAGAPAADFTGRAVASMRVAKIVHADDSGALPMTALSLIHTAVLESCDALDGVKDGVVENPRACRFDPGVLQCKAGQSSCLSAPQVASAREIYASPENPVTGRPNTGLEPGSELGWATWGGAQPFGIGSDYFRYVVFRNPVWDFKTFDFARDIARAEQIDGGTIDALDPDLSRFVQRGGKILQYHGWGDPQISPGNSVQYYERAAEKLGGTARNSYRLFMVPGMAHCSGGEGPNNFDALTALERWVESGTAPDRLIASRLRDGQTVRTRPLCPYPQVAVYGGSGSTDEASSFACSAAGHDVR